MSQKRMFCLTFGRGSSCELLSPPFGKLEDENFGIKAPDGVIGVDALLAILQLARNGGPSIVLNQEP